MYKLSVTIITLNEEDNIRRCIESVQKVADEIIVVDSGSTDKTEEIVKELGAKFVYNSWPGYREQKNYAISLTSNEWIFSIDADEWIDKALSDEISGILAGDENTDQALSQSSPCDAYEIDRKTMFIGEFVKVWSPDWIVRLFKKSVGSFGGGDIHESVKLASNASCGRLKSQFYHETDKDLAGYFIRNCQDTSLAAKTMFDKGKQFRYSKLIFSPLWAFLKRFFIKGGWSDGYRGLIISVTGAFYSFMQYAKLWGLYRNAGRQDFTEACHEKKVLTVGHLNFAQGYRGGERQTEMLIKSLAQLSPFLAQKIFIRKGSPLASRLEKVDRLTIVEVSRPFIISVFKLKDCDLIHGHENHGARMAAEAHFLFHIPYFVTRRVLNLPSLNFFNRYIYYQAASVICLSKAVSAVIEERFKKATLEIIPSMSSDLEVSPDTVNRLKKQYENKVLVGHAGALVCKDKGQHFIIDLARELSSVRPHIHFMFLGSGRDEDRLKKQADGLSNVTFTGFKDNVIDYLSAFDIFLFPSLMEGFGSVLLDVMKVGTPVVAARTGGIVDLIKDRENGLLFDTGDNVAMKKALLELIDNKNLQQNLRDQGLKAGKRYSAEKIAFEYLHLYRTFLKLDN